VVGNTIRQKGAHAVSAGLVAGGKGVVKGVTSVSVSFFSAFSFQKKKHFFVLKKK
jgi:hypothetical protein